MNLNQVTVPVLDVEAAVAFYRGLGLRQIVGSLHYARFVGFCFSRRLDAVNAFTIR